MGLLDILNGMQNGPRGQAQPTTPDSSGGGGLSPLTMALIGLLAFKALKGLGGGSKPSAVPPPPGGARPTPLPGNTAGPGASPSASGTASPSAGPTGSLSDILGGLLGGLTGRPGSGGSPNLNLPGGAGNVLSGGLGNLIRDLQSSGQGRVAQSWVSTGPNEEIEPDDLAKALGADTIKTLTAQTGMSRDELLEGLSQQLPEMVDQLTPNGRLPTRQEAERWV